MNYLLTYLLTRKPSLNSTKLQHNKSKQHLQQASHGLWWSHVQTACD